MKRMIRSAASLQRIAGIVALLGCAGLFASYVRAGETVDGKDGKATAATTTEEKEEYKNWIELGIGGVIVHGDTAQFEQEHRLPGDQVYGGIQDLHFEQGLPNDVQLTVDGHAIWDINDYNLRVDLSKAKVGYLRFGYDEFRSWYDGNGGFFPHHDVFFPPPIPEMHIDRGAAWVELGLRVPDWPEITLHYEHQFRFGQKDSTIWGDTTLTGLKVNPARKIAPAFRDIDETRDFFAADILKTIGNTDFILGMRYEHSDIDNRLQLERGAGQLPPRVAPPGAQRFITQHDELDNDIFNGHAITETRFTDSFWFTGAYSYSSLSGDLSGTQIVGPHYNSLFGEPYPFQRFDEGYLNLAGVSDEREHVFNSNLFWIPLPDLNVIAGFRYTRQDKDSSSFHLATTVPANGTPPNTEEVFADSSNELNNFAQRLELRYTHIQNWLFYLEAEWEEEFGTIREHEVVEGVDQGNLDKDTHLLGQKYTAGATWYPAIWLNLAAQYYHKIADYDNDFNSDLATPPVPGSERNQRMLGQDWHTDDVNVRITLRPKIPGWLGTMALVSRYDYLVQSAESKWGISPANPPGVGLTGITLDEVRSGWVIKHMISESINWNPTARLYLQTNVSVVLDQTHSGASYYVLIPNTSPTFVNARNDYWTVSAGGGYVLDRKTDVRADYSFYRANDYFNNAPVAMPYGMGATQHTASGTLTREIAKNVRLVLKYTYFNYSDLTSGGHNNYQAHSIYSGLQIRF